MKKVFSLLAATLILLASGCEKQKTDSQKSASLPEAFVSQIEVKHGENLMIAEFSQTSFGNGTVRVTKPESLSPLEMTFTNEKCIVNFNSLEFETDYTRFPQAEYCAIIVQTLAYIGTGIDIEKTVENGKLCYRGSCEHGVFTLRQNNSNGKLEELIIESAELEVTFTKFEKA